MFTCTLIAQYCVILKLMVCLVINIVFKQYILTVQYTPYFLLVWEVSYFNLKGTAFLSVVFHTSLVLQEYWVYRVIKKDATGFETAIT